MKKLLTAVMVFIMVFSLVSCSNDEGTNVSSNTDQKLTMLGDDNQYFSNNYGTAEGFYYISEEKETEDGQYGYYLMYMDYKAQKEVFLCFDSSCKHNTSNCSAFLNGNEFGMDSMPFVWNNQLYVLSRSQDDDGTQGIDLLGGGMGVDSMVSANQGAKLYKMNLDGSHRELAYTFPQNITTEKAVFGEDNNLWFVTKELVTDTDKNQSMTTSINRNLSRLSLDDFEIDKTISLDKENKVRYSVMGAYDGKFVLSGTKYPKGLSEDEVNQLSENQWREATINSSLVFALLDVENEEIKDVYEAGKQGLRSTYRVIKDALIYADGNNGGVYKVDLETGKETKLSDTDKNYIMYADDDYICCSSNDTSGDNTLYFINTKTGKLHHCKLKNKSLGWPLDVLASTKDQFLVIYDYEYDEVDQDAYEINRYKYALIEKEKLLSGKGDYTPIKMVSKGK